MLKVWGRKSSSNVQSVMWCIAGLGLPVERIVAHHDQLKQRPCFQEHVMVSYEELREPR